MKKYTLILLLALSSSLLAPQNCGAQNPSYQQKLYYTCKVWGFVKYFHSNVSVCGVNWDSVLIADLPLVKSAVTSNDFNNALDTMLNAAGPMALTTSPPCDTVTPELKRNLNTKWLNDTSIFRNDVITILDTINNNFRPHAECWVEIDPSPYNYGYLKFGADTLILNIDDYINYPDEWHRLLELFAHWNIINYFNPYNYVQNQPWDSTLYQNVLNIDSASNDDAFFIAFLKITSNMDDAHVEGQTGDTYCAAPLKGYYSPLLVLKYIPGKYIVVQSGVNGMINGDEIVAVNGLTTKQWEDSLRPYLSAGDSAAFHLAIMEFIIQEGYGQTINITYLDSLNNSHTTSAVCSYKFVYNGYYPNDTLANVQWKYWSNCNIGYVNVGKMQDVHSDVATMYSALQNTNAIIFDIRNYPASNAVFDLVNKYLFHFGYTPLTKFMIPNVNYPGTYFWSYTGAAPGSSNPYKGKIIILFNEQTISEAEFACMSLAQLPNALKIGSQTDGTDGNITYYNLSQKMGTGFTSLGVFYPNGDSTERVGIIPDSLVYPTQEGIRHGRDEVLEKALQVAGCPTAVPELKAKSEEVRVYPNPNNGIFTISLSHPELVSGSQIIEVYNVMGQCVFSEILRSTQDDNLINLSNQPNGVYFYRVIKEDGALLGQGEIVVEK